MVDTQLASAANVPVRRPAPAVAVLEWALVYAWLSGALSVASASALQRAGHLFTFYLMQLSVLLALFTAACLLSRSSIFRDRRADKAAT